MNRALWTSMAGIGAAQVLKIPLNQLHNGGALDYRDLFRTGGMPSSHSAGVTALATYIGLRKGCSSTSFALSVMLGLIVMYDAMGIRRHAGLIATEVNNLEEAVVRLTEQHPTVAHSKRDKELEERLGHLPTEVLGGAMLGALTGMISYLTESRRKRDGVLSFMPRMISRFL